MKRLTALAILTCLTMATAAQADSYPLYAGQDILVGTVEVEVKVNGELCITYQLDVDGWLLYETHWAVAADLDGIPTNKAGNPQPGQFPYGDDELGGVQSYEECVDLGDLCGDVVIAAHAVVRKTDSTQECLVSGADTDDVLLLAEDATNLGYPEGYTGPYQVYAGTASPAVLTWTHSAWGPYGIAGAEWISSDEYAEDPDNNTWRLFTRTFTLPDNAVNITGTLTMNCDNAEEAYLNGAFVGDGSPAVVYGPSLASGGGRHGWDSVEGPWDITSELAVGQNELWTMTRNYGWLGGVYANPTGLIYKLCYSYDIVTTESAWGAEEGGGTRFVEKGNWATHFTYTVGCDEGQ